MQETKKPVEKVAIVKLGNPECRLLGSSKNLKAFVEEMLDKKTPAWQANGTGLEITLSGMVKCACSNCKHSYLVGLPDRSETGRGGKSAEFRKCTLLEVDPLAAASVISHSNAVEAEKMVKVRDEISGDNKAPAYVLLETKYKAELEEIEKEAKNQS